jgi:hypothetical protein
MIGYPLGQLYEEVACLAYYFHWPHDQVLSLDHRERRRWLEEVNKIHRSIKR